MNHLFILSFIHSFIHPFIHLFIHSSIHSFMDWLISYLIIINNWFYFSIMFTSYFTTSRLQKTTLPLTNTPSSQTITFSYHTTIIRPTTSPSFIQPHHHHSPNHTTTIHPTTPPSFIHPHHHSPNHTTTIHPTTPPPFTQPHHHLSSIHTTILHPTTPLPGTYGRVFVGHLVGSCEVLRRKSVNKKVLIKTLTGEEEEELSGDRRKNWQKK